MSQRNVIILTSGLTGSSVLTGLISRAGYWTGDQTQKKDDYDTFENQALIGWNMELFRQAGYEANYLTDFSAEAIRRIASLSGKIDETPYRAFVQHCNQNQPWVWKDPRLWLTIRFWKNLIGVQSCRFILLTRSYMQCWISATLRRQIRTYGHAKRYEQSIRDSILEFLRESKAPYLTVSYEDLIVRPEAAIDKLNAHLTTNLSIADLKAVYHKPLYRNPRRSSVDHLKAGLIYAKNYSQRLK